MSFEHKAFEFSWHHFQSEFGPILSRALAERNEVALRHFVTINVDFCCDPYTGKPLNVDWEASLEVADIQEIADFALTKYYRVKEDFGIGGIWLEVSDSLPAAHRDALLGKPFGPPSSMFDPGRQGSYFMAPSDLKDAALLLSTSQHFDIQAYRQRLSVVAGEGAGLYVTF